MNKFDLYDDVKFDYDGKEMVGFINGINRKTADVFIPEIDETKRIPLDKLVFLPPISLNAEQIHKLCRCEASLSGVCGDLSNHSHVINVTEEYLITVDDVIAAMKNIKILNDLTVFDEWHDLVYIDLYQDYDEIDFECSPDNVENYTYLPDRADSLYEAFETMMPILFFDDKKTIGEAADSIIEYLQNALDNETKAPEDRIYSKEEKKRYLRCMDNDDSLKRASETELRLFRRFADELCKEDSKTALRCKGYGCYGGNPAYECDWNTSLECITRLLELTGKPVYANTLGYIYYYGRCWDGQPKYEEAFKYFSIGAAGGYYESSYKLADMFAQGLGVPQNTALAYRIVETLYYRNLVYMVNGEFDCKFADVAMRLGRLTEKGEVIRPNYEQAYYYYLQADFAIKQRLRYDHYGDTSVASKIRQRIDDLLGSGNLEKPKKTSEVFLLQLLEYHLKKYRKLQMDIKVLKNGEYSLKIRIVPFKKEKYPPKMFITNTDTGFCGVIEVLKLRLKNAKALDKTDITKTIYFDDIGGDSFYLGDNITASLDGTYYFTNPVHTNGKKYKFASVYFNEGKRHYDYLLELDDVAVGDTVAVLTDRGETEVTVADIFEKSEPELPLPLSSYKKILKKIIP